MREAPAIYDRDVQISVSSRAARVLTREYLIFEGTKALRDGIVIETIDELDALVAQLGAERERLADLAAAGAAEAPSLVTLNGSTFAVLAAWKLNTLAEEIAAIDPWSDEDDKSLHNLPRLVGDVQAMGRVISDIADAIKAEFPPSVFPSMCEAVPA